MWAEFISTAIEIYPNNTLITASSTEEDPSWLDNRLADPESVFLPYHSLKPLLTPDKSSLRWIPQHAVSQLLGTSTVVLLGIAPAKGGKVAHFAIDVTKVQNLLQVCGEGVFEEARAAVVSLATDQGGTVAQGRSLLDWNLRSRHCPNCGALTSIKDGGRWRKCPSCDANHFPRLDPVVISLVKSHDGEYCLLGRKREFRKGVWSVLAGFMEPGETMEDAVRREVFEESGVVVDEVTYFRSQPWPFPSSLMLGCIGRAAAHGEGSTGLPTIKTDTHELEDARWFSKEDITQMLHNALSQRQQRAQPQPAPNTEVLMVPGPEAIAHHLIRAFVL